MTQAISLIESLIDNRKEEFAALCRQHHLKTLYVFGSAVTDAFHIESDIDFLYRFNVDKFMIPDVINADFDYADNLFSFEKALTLFFNRRIDLIAEANVTNKYFRQEIEQTKHQIYAA